MTPCISQADMNNFSFSTRTLHLEVRLQELSLKIQNLQASHLAESRFTRDSQQDMLKTLFVKLNTLQEVVEGTDSAIHSLGHGFSGSRDPVSCGSNQGKDPMLGIQHERVSNTTALSSENHAPAVIGLSVRQLATSACRQIAAASVMDVDTGDPLNS